MLILASGSPRRKELLAQIGIAYMVDPSSFNEGQTKHKDPEKYVKAQALGKACDISLKYRSQWILGADTVVSIDGKILGKPKSEEEAFHMLKELSGAKHSVFTGVALVNGKEQLTKVVETKVWFRKLSDDEIQRYIATGEPMDKAGAYGIQGKAAGFVERINGSYTNVVGLPLAQVHKLLKKARVIP